MKNGNSILGIYHVSKPHGLSKLLLDISAIIIASYNFIIANIIQMLFQRKSEMNIGSFALFIICIITVVLGAVSYYIIKKFSAENSLKIEKELKDKLLSKLNNDNYLRVECLNDGEWMTIIDSDVNRVSNFYPKCIVNSISGVLGFCLAILFGVRSSWKLTLLIMFFSMLSFFLPKLIQKQLVKSTTKAQKLQEYIRQFIPVTFNKIPLIKLTKSYEMLQKRFNKQTYLYEQESINQARMTSFLASLFTLITYVSMAIWIFIGVYFISIGSMTIGGLLGFITLSSSFNWPLYIAPIIQRELVQAQVSYNRITEFLSKEDGVKEGLFQRLQIDKNSDTVINVHDLSFSYQPEDENDEKYSSLVLKYPNFAIQKNEKVLLEGDSGTGKTTLMKLLLGLYDSLSGGISLNGKSSSRAIFSYVPQSNNVFTGTIYENLVIGNPKASYEEMKKALKQAAAFDFVEKLDEGIDTKIGSGYRQLSGGQAQRICLARAFLSNSEIMMIDEGTSAIDPENKRLIIETLKKIDKTIVLISHDAITQTIANRTISVKNEKAFTDEMPI